MPGSFRLGKIAGIDIYAHLSWFIVLVLLTWSLASGWFVQLFPGWSTPTYWITAFISALLLFVCVLLHELAHVVGDLRLQVVPRTEAQHHRGDGCVRRHGAWR